MCQQLGQVQHYYMSSLAIKQIWKYQREFNALSLGTEIIMISSADLKHDKN
jgi:hypothetical protein